LVVPLLVRSSGRKRTKTAALLRSGHSGPGVAQRKAPAGIEQHVPALFRRCHYTAATAKRIGDRVSCTQYRAYAAKTTSALEDEARSTSTAPMVSHFAAWPHSGLVTARRVCGSLASYRP